MLEAVFDSLVRFQHRCKEGPFPAASNFWNYQGSGTHRTNFRPKDEEDLSDGIAAWLRDDLGPARGIVINREVQPRRGQKTDIYVNAVSRVKHEDNVILTVVIEVKGCWNNELLEAMESQLVNGYMKENAHAYGLYVVGWYACDEWDSTDYRQKLAKKRTRQELDEHVLRQAKNVMTKYDFIRRIKPFILDASL